MSNTDIEQLRKEFEDKFEGYEITGQWEWFLSKLNSTIDQVVKQTAIKEKNISMLRQWINEGHGERMVTNDDIKYWLGDGEMKHETGNE